MIRLNAYLASLGVGSRRKCDEYIQSGLIRVNGASVTKLGTKIDPEKDRVETDSSLPNLVAHSFVYYMLHKPVGVVSTVSGKETPKIIELVPKSPRVFPIGRLDKLTSGLILLTNDGRFANQIIHPKHHIEKEYIVRIREKLSIRHLTKLRECIYIRGKKTREAQITQDAPHRFRVVLHEGRNRHIRRLCEHAGLTIERLKRIRIGHLLLGNLASGAWRKLQKNEISRFIDYPA